ncbi:trimeric intracellular cation channel family protein [Thiomicrorhabdus lithotrophica]|uniref:Trimeric intracellular cation channel family protein n=1 Tax=Thiomicrorhabdus lithotrophica TaxID=2949997 RepID=A0ABY8CEL2_9GAMM|nr:trimeric intracellular cation channel family protein [Thiomicrorhabdus lithotrophica]WEJ63692.1 trimeric intracellular cation channel family protein [Thiomicrorhabdus lithotrophica]
MPAMTLAFTLHYLDLIGTVVFAITGLLAARRKQLDLFGAIVIAMVTAIGGGTLRDLIIDEPVFWTQDDTYIYIVVISALFLFFFARFRRLPVKLLLFLDALGLAVFTVIGTEKALALGFSDPIAIMTGIMTGVVGGIIRDVLVGEVPLVFRKEIYATASFVGASIFLLMEHAGFAIDVSVIVSIFITLLMRVWAIMFNIELPVFISYKAPEAHFQKKTPSKKTNNKADKLG